MKTPYPRYDVLAKWGSPSFNDATREALAARLAAPPPFRFFTGDDAILLQAVVDRLLPQPDREIPIPVAAWVDDYLFEGRDQGFRDARLPPLHESWRRALSAIDHEAKRRFQAGFSALAPEQQDAVLSAVQAGDVDAEAWGDLDAADFFRDDLLTTAAQHYYAQPAAWSEIGFGGPASPRGYVRMGADERDPWEAPPEERS